MTNTTETLLIIALGNPILGDDAVGWEICKEVERLLVQPGAVFPPVEFAYLSLGGLSLMERMEGYKDVIVVDSIVTGNQPQGTINSMPLSALPNLSSGHSTAAHDTSLATALEVGKKMGMVLPEDVWVVAVEARHVYDFSEELSPEIARAVPEASKIVLDILKTEDTKRLMHKEFDGLN